MNKTTDSLTAHPGRRQELPEPDAPDGFPSFDDLQPFFDEQSRRLAAILDRPEARITALNRSAGGTLRRRMLRAWIALAVVFIVLAAYWGVALWKYFDYNVYFRVYTLFLEAVLLLFAVHSVVKVIFIIRHNPARASFESMLRYSRRSGMCTSCKDARRSGTNIFNLSVSIVSFLRPVYITVAAVVVFVLITCIPSIGDGYIISPNCYARVEIVDNVTSILRRASLI